MLYLFYILTFTCYFNCHFFRANLQSIAQIQGECEIMVEKYLCIVDNNLLAIIINLDLLRSKPGGGAQVWFR